jgi:hypothetical protein
MEEIWKVTPVNLNYEVSNLGNIKNIKKNKILNQNISNRGYKYIKIIIDNKTKFISSHRLIMLTFKPEEQFEGCEINHKDGNKLNNILDNLEWVSHKDNIQHAYDNNLIHTIGSDKFNSKLMEEQVLEIRKLYNEGYSQAKLGELYNVSQYNISLIVTNKMWKHLSWEPKPIKEKLIKEKRIYTTGEKCKSSKLTEQQVLEIRRLYPEVKSYVKMAKQYNVSDNAIKKVVLRKSWTHI